MNALEAHHKLTKLDYMSDSLLRIANHISANPELKKELGVLLAVVKETDEQAKLVEDKLKAIQL